MDLMFVKAFLQAMLRCAAGTIFFASILHCSKPSKKETEKTEVPATGTIKDKSHETRSSEISLNLVGADTFHINIEGCASGNNPSLDNNSADVNIYRFDRGCLAKLIDFGHGSKSYTPEPGFEFTTWAEGDQATFISDDATERFLVKVASQLSDPVMDSDTINYTFFKIVKSVVTVDVLDVDPGNKDTVGQNAPAFSVSSVEYVGEVGATGAFKFVFKLHCNSALTNVGTPSLTACSGVKLNDTSYALVRDTYNDQPCSEATASTCASIVAGNSPLAVDASSADLIEPGTNGIANGGFFTKTGASTLTSHADIAGDPHMILILKNTVAGSYQFFNIDVKVDHTLGAPEFYSVDLAGDATDDYINIADHSQTNNLVGNLQGLSFSTAEYKLVTFATSCNGPLSYSSTVPTSNSSDFGSDGVYKVCVKLSAAGYDSVYGSSLMINFDSSVPTISSASLANEAVDGYINIADRSTTNALVGAITGSGYDVVEYKLTSSATTCDGSLTYGAMPTGNSSDFGSDGNYKICVKVSDYAGNGIAYAGTSPIVLDTIAPTLSSVTLNAPAADGYVNNSEKTSTNALILVSASGFATDDFSAPLDNTPAVTCDGTKTYSYADRPLVNNIPAADDSYVVCVRLLDAANNPTYGTSPAVLRDVTPPSGVVLTNQPNGYETPTFNWSIATETGSGFSAYLIEVDDNSDFSSVYHSNQITNINTLQHTASAGLVAGTNYWRITASDVAGNSQIYLPSDPDFTVTLQTPVLTDIADKTLTNNELLNTATFSFDINNTVVGSDINMTYSCVFDNNISGAVSGSTNCNTLPGMISFNTATAEFSWTPGAEAYGSYEIKITGTNANGSDTEIIGVNVQQAYTTSNLLLDVQATFANALNPGTGSLATWSNLTGGGSNGTLTNFNFNASSGWLGSGSMASPYNLRFDGSNDFVDFGTPASGQTELGFTAWLAPKNGASMTGNVVLAVGSAGSADGFRLTQSDKTANKLKLSVGKTYPQMVLADGAVFYWRLNDASGSTTAVDLGPNASNGGYLSSLTHGVTGILAENGQTAADFVGNTNQYVNFTSHSSFNNAQFDSRSIELWFNADNVTKRQVLFEEGNGTRGHGIHIQGGNIYVVSYDTGTFGVKYESNSVSTGTAYHVVLVFDATDRVKGYLNGVRFSNTANGGAVGIITSHTNGSVGARNSNVRFYDNTTTCDASIGFGSACPFDGKISDVAVYNTLLSASAIANHYSQGSQICESSTLVDDEWINMAGVYDKDAIPKTLKLYVNGSKVCEINPPGSFMPGSNKLFVGAADASATLPWNGSIAGLKVYSAIGEANQLADYQTTSPSFFDALPPTFVSLNGLNGASDGYVNNNEKTSVSTMFALSASGYSTAVYTNILSTPQTCDGSLSYPNASLPAINGLPGSDGTYIICVKLQDNSSNVTYGQSQAIVKDTAAPTFTSLAGASEALDGYIDLTETGSTNAIVELSASGYSTANYTAILDNTPSQTCDASQTYSSSDSPPINTMPPFDDDYVVCVKLADAAGNISYGTSSVIVRSANPPPVFTSVDLAYDVADGILSGSEHAFTNNLVANLVASNYSVAEYAVALSTTTCDGSLSYGSIPKSNASEFGSDHTYKVCVKLSAAGETDVFGNSSNVVYDTTNPSGVVLTDEPDGNVTPTLQWSIATETGSGFLHYVLEVDNNNDFSSITYSKTITNISTLSDTTTALPAGTYYWRIRAVDNANNGQTFYPSDTSFVATPPAPVLTTIADYELPDGAFTTETAGTTIDVDNENAGNDIDMTYTCAFDKVVSNSVTGTDCGSLPGTVSFSTAAGTLAWTPGYHAYGTYEIKVTGSNLGGSDTEIFFVTVRQNYSTTGRIFDLEAQFADQIAGGSGSLGTWDDISPAGKDGTLTNFNFTGSSGWTGDGSRTTPYSLLFDGTNDVLDLGANIVGESAKMFATWISPSDALNTSGDMLLATGVGNSKNGFRLFQSTANAGKLRLKIGKSYDTEVLADSPNFYWRLGETSGTTAVDIGSAGHNGTYVNSPTLNATSIVPENANSAMQLSGTNNVHMEVSSHSQLTNGDFPTRTMELWFNANDVTKRQILFESGSGTRGHSIYIEDGNVYVNSWRSSSDNRYKYQAISAGQTYHVVLEWNEAAAGGTSAPPTEGWLNGVKFMNDGVVTAASSIASHSNDSGIGGVAGNARFADDTTTCNATIGYGSTCPFNGVIDEVVVYNTLLSEQRIKDHYYAGSTFCETTALTNGTWTHIAATYDNSSYPAIARLYVNAKRVCETSTSSTFDPGSEDLFVGASDELGTNGWNGKIADLKFYSTVSETTVRSIFDATYPRFNIVPSEVANLGAWFLADKNLSIDGSSLVQTWSSRNGASNSLASTMGAEPTYVSSRTELNRRPALRFDGSADHLDFNTPLTDGNEFTWFIVYVDDNTAASSTYFGASGSNLRNQGSTATKASFRIVDAASIDQSINEPSQAAAHLVTIGRDSSNKVDAFIDSGSATRLFSNAAQSGTASIERIGATTSGTGFFQGDIAEIIVFTSALSTPDRTAIKDYLNAKYQFTP
ncbi:MAG: LamG-like jellyroll fold domain-containing protein [Oligoflexales bacterium]